MDYKLFDFFNSLTDPRRGQGQRHKLTDVLTIIIMAILSGHQGLKVACERPTRFNLIEQTPIQSERRAEAKNRSLRKARQTGAGQGPSTP